MTRYRIEVGATMYPGPFADDVIFTLEVDAEFEFYAQDTDEQPRTIKLRDTELQALCDLFGRIVKRDMLDRTFGKGE